VVEVPPTADDEVSSILVVDSDEEDEHPSTSDECFVLIHNCDEFHSDDASKRFIALKLVKGLPSVLGGTRRKTFLPQGLCPFDFQSADANDLGYTEILVAYLIHMFGMSDNIDLNEMEATIPDLCEKIKPYAKAAVKLKDVVGPHDIPSPCFYTNFYR